MDYVNDFIVDLRMDIAILIQKLKYAKMKIIVKDGKLSTVNLNITQIPICYQLLARCQNGINKLF